MSFEQYVSIRYQILKIVEIWSGNFDIPIIFDSEGGTTILIMRFWSAEYIYNLKKTFIYFQIWSAVEFLKWDDLFGIIVPMFSSSLRNSERQILLVYKMYMRYDSKLTTISKEVIFKRIMSAACKKIDKITYRAIKLSTSIWRTQSIKYCQFEIPKGARLFFLTSINYF